MYKDDYSFWGMAIAIGHLEIIEKWEHNETFIGHVLNGADYDLFHAIFYGSTELGEGLYKKEMEEVLKDF